VPDPKASIPQEAMCPVGFEQLELARRLERRAAHLRASATERRPVIGKLHVLEYIVPRSLEHLRRLAREINAGHGHVELRLLDGLISRVELTLGLGPIRRAEHPLPVN
jgi:hypothetical protein